jgi:hypothetical protein
VKGKTYTKAPSGVERPEAKQLVLPKGMTAAEIAKKVKSTERRVLARCKALARAKRIFGVCGWRKVDVPTTRIDPQGRKVMTFRKKRRQVCKFATFGPDGSVGFFARGEHKLPDENPDQPEFSFVQRAYVVKERKPIARSTGRRMRASDEVLEVEGGQQARHADLGKAWRAAVASPGDAP